MEIISSEREGVFTQKLGSLLHEGWQLKKSLSSCVSNSFIDDAYESAMRAGAYGGKIAGAGGGGFLMLLVAPEHRTNVRKALSNLLEVEFKFEDTGSSIIYYKD
jgi:D-glycero-alpha-D-manno-heptose-7-phosphate kinase